VQATGDMQGNQGGDRTEQGNMEIVIVTTGKLKEDQAKFV